MEKNYTNIDINDTFQEGIDLYSVCWSP